jgi:hypothetical protein
MKQSPAEVLDGLRQLDPAPEVEVHAASRDGGDEAILGRILDTPRFDTVVDPHTEAAISGRMSSPHVPRSIVALGSVAAAVVVLVALVWIAAPPAPHLGGSGPPKSHVTVPPAPGPWKLTADLTGAQFQLATGTPGSVAGVTCADETTCFLSTGYGLDYGGGGGMFVSHDGGHSFASSAIPANEATTTLVSCASATWCAAGAGLLDAATGDPAADKPMRDPELLITSDAGLTWHVVPIPIPVDIVQLPAYGSLPAETTVWPGEVDAVLCSSPGVCSVLGHTMVANPTGPDRFELVYLHTADAGAHWTSSVLPERPDESAYQVVVSNGSSESMSCPTATTCLVEASLFPLSMVTGVVDVWKTTDLGGAWKENRVSGVTSSRSPLSCPTPTSCFLIPATSAQSPQASLLHSSDGGTTWSPVTVPAPTTAGPGDVWGSVSCASATVCFLAGVGIEETTNAGATWQPVSLPAAAGGIVQISCSAQQACAALANPVGSNTGANEGSVILTWTPPGS